MFHFLKKRCNKDLFQFINIKLTNKIKKNPKLLIQDFINDAELYIAK